MNMLCSLRVSLLQPSGASSVLLSSCVNIVIFLVDMFKSLCLIG